jgi:hypothetical protein
MSRIVSAGAAVRRWPAAQATLGATNPGEPGIFNIVDPNDVVSTSKAAADPSVARRVQNGLEPARRQSLNEMTQARTRTEPPSDSQTEVRSLPSQHHCRV